MSRSRIEEGLRKPGSAGRVSVRLLVAGLLAIVAIVAAILFWRRHLDTRPIATNVVVILVDTLRADHLSLYGYPRPTSPDFDRRAARSGAVFENARSQAPCTFPSVNSILTSRSPLAFLHHEKGQHFEIPASIPSLSTVLSAAGYATAAVSASPIVRATPSKENPRGGFGAGFDRFDEQCYWGGADCVTGKAKQALDELREPFFLYVHYLDPHDPYVAPKGRRRFTGEVPQGPNAEFLERGDPNPVATRLYEEKRDAGLSPAEIAYFVDRYDDEIRFWDSQVELLFRRLEQSGLARRTLVVVTSDHGEEFLEHGHIKHCRTLFDTELRVPFVVFAPGMKPRRLREPVANLDLVPTVLDYLAVRPLHPSFEGTSLRPLISGRRGTLERQEPVQLAWWSGDRSVSDGRFKLILSRNRREGQLFDLVEDPGETRNVAATQRRSLSHLSEALARWARRDPGPRQARPDEIEQTLRTLGYLQ